MPQHIQQEASILSVPQRWQRTVGKRYKHLHLSGRKHKSIEESKGECTRHISAFKIPPIFAYHISHFSWHRDVGYYVSPCIQPNRCEGSSFLIHTNEQSGLFICQKMRASRRNLSVRDGCLLCQTDCTVETPVFTQLRTRGISCLAGPAAAAPSGTAHSNTSVWPCLTLTLLTCDKERTDIPEVNFWK